MSDEVFSDADISGDHNRLAGMVVFIRRSQIPWIIYRGLIPARVVFHSNCIAISLSRVGRCGR